MDKKRKTIGLIFTGSSDWIGGLYYIANIVKSLSYLEIKDRPNVVLFYDKITPKGLLKELDFNFVKQVDLYEINKIKRLFFSLLYRVLNRNYLFRYHIDKQNVDVIYPLNYYHKDLEFINVEKLYWIFDFQHKFLPQFFTKDEIKKRNKAFKEIADKANSVVVSSYTAKNHFYHFYPKSKAKVHVLQFVSIIDENKITDFNSLKEKYNIKTPYYLVSNQFWQHKNHMVVFEAINKLKKQNIEINVVFTGKEYEPRNPDYIVSIKEYIKINKLEKNIKMLGFIPREDQLGLMKNCIAIIQPSKFEGWGTVVEDAKSLGKQVILSDIEIHREQMLKDYLLFSVNDDKQLAELLSENKFKSNLYIEQNNKERYKTFATNINNII